MSDFYSVAKAATDLFCTFSDEKPAAVDIGIPALRQRIGRLFAGNTVVIGAAQNVGKTSFVQRMLLSSEDKGGVASGEDDIDVWGTRILAEAAGLPPASIRTDALSESERDRLSLALGDLQRRSALGTLPEFQNVIGAGVERLEEAAEALAAKGCKYAVLDYLQKFRNIHGERRHEVGIVMSSWHRACSRNGMVPVILSQVVRMDAHTEPQSWNLKESGDIENEARIILLLWRDPGDELLMRCKVSKSSFGGGGTRFAYRFSDSESLEPWNPEEEEF